MSLKEEILKSALASKVLKGESKEDIEARLESLLRLFERLNLLENQIKYIFKRYAVILTYEIGVAENAVADMQTLGFTAEQINTMIKCYAPVLKMTLDDFLRLYGFFSEIDFEEEDFRCIISNNARLLEKSANEIGEAINSFFKIPIYRRAGLPPLYVEFTKDEIYSMICASPGILTIPYEQMQGQFQMFFEVGFTPEEMHHIFFLAPEILLNKISKNQEKIEYYRDIEVLQGIYDQPTRMRQSLELSRARAHYLKGHNVYLETISGINMLFEKSNYYKSIYGVTNSDVAHLYEVQMELEAKRAKELQKRKDALFGKGKK